MSTFTEKVPPDRGKRKDIDGHQHPPSKTKKKESAFKIAALIVKGLKDISKIQMSKTLKVHLPNAKIENILKSQTNLFTIQAQDVHTFNQLLTNFPKTAFSTDPNNIAIYIPRTIRQVFETEKIAFLKHVDQEITDKEIEEALFESNFAFEKVQRIMLKKDNRSTKSVKIIFSDRSNRDTLVRSGLNIGFLKFQAERALPSNKPLQCFRCWGYGHTSKYCHREELCRKCAEHHSSTTCSNQLIKCANCSLAHEANNVNCPKHVEQKEKIQKTFDEYIVTPSNNLRS